MLDPTVRRFENLLAVMGDEEKRKEFDEAGRDRAVSMAKLSPRIDEILDQ